MDLSRRTALEAGVGALTMATLAGCLDDSSDDSSSPDYNYTEDYPEGVDESDGNVTGRTGENGYEMYETQGQEIPMAPTDDVYDWYMDDGKLVVADARKEWQYEERHIRGAVSSPAPYGQESDDPLADLASDAWIVTYCTCPKTLSGYRAAALKADGYTNVYILKDGLQDWDEKGYPLAGTEVN